MTTSMSLSGFIAPLALSRQRTHVFRRWRIWRRQMPPTLLSQCGRRNRASDPRAALRLLAKSASSPCLGGEVANMRIAAVVALALFASSCSQLPAESPSADHPVIPFINQSGGQNGWLTLTVGSGQLCTDTTGPDGRVWFEDQVADQLAAVDMQ